MNITRRHALASAIGAAAATLLPPAAVAATTVVKVSLWDHGAASMNMMGQGPMMGMGMGMGMGHQGAAGRRGPMGPMGITLSTRTVRTGKVTFAVSNDSKALVHEMVVTLVKDVNKPLPYDQAGNKVDEDAAGHLGEVAELEPGKTGALTLTLARGRYILYCNVPGHYALGMWTLLTVS